MKYPPESFFLSLLGLALLAFSQGCTSGFLHIQLDEPVVITDGRVQLQWWVQDDIADFIEYRLYRHTTSALTDQTGTLIHVSTSPTDTTFIDSDFSLPGDYYYRVYVLDTAGITGSSNIVLYHLPPSIIKVTIHYTGSHMIDSAHQVYLGFSTSAAQHELQDDGVFVENDSSLLMVIDDPDSWYYQYIQYDDPLIRDTYGPFYIGAFLDISGNHQGSSFLPTGCPAIVFDGIDPFSAEEATPITVNRGTTTDISLDFDDSHLVP